MSSLNYWSLRYPGIWFDNGWSQWDAENQNVIIDLSRVTTLGGEPVTLAEAKTQLRVTYTDDDTEIAALITKAIRALENYLNISIVYQRIQLIASMVRDWKLPYGPVIGIESVSDSQPVTGSGPVTFEASTANWSIEGDKYGPGGVYRQKIVYTAGNFCPPDLKDCILNVISWLYENRGAEASKDGLVHIMERADRYKVMLWI